MYCGSRKRMLLGHCSLALVVGLSGCGSTQSDAVQENQAQATETATGHTPQDVFETANAALKREDYHAFCACLIPETRDTIAGTLVVAAPMIKAMGGIAALGGSKQGENSQELFAALDKVLASHGITDDAVKKIQQDAASGNVSAAELDFTALAAPIQDKSAFVAEVLTLLKEMPGGQIPLPDKSFDGVLEDLAVEGDSATGVVRFTRNGQERTDPIEFHRIDGTWLIEMPLDEGAGPG